MSHIVVSGSTFLGEHGGNNGTWGNKTTENASHTHTITISPAGGNKGHENRPPYIVVYRFRRTS